MIIHKLNDSPSVLNTFLNQIREVSVQKDSLRFRKNIERIGELMAYEISKQFSYDPITITTPLSEKQSYTLSNNIVICSILRAGLALHQGFLNYFDRAECGYISAYRHHYNNDDLFDIKVQYQAIPALAHKNVILVDPMLATGQSIVAVYNEALHTKEYNQLHIAVVIAAPEGIQYLSENLPDSVHLWIADTDDYLNEKKYIVPGLGDAGDLCFGEKTDV